MEAAEHSFGGERLIILNKLRGKASGSESGLVENFGKPAATIAKTTGLK
jgi:hypothetical protein